MTAGVWLRCLSLPLLTVVLLACGTTPDGPSGADSASPGLAGAPNEPAFGWAQATLSCASRAGYALEKATPEDTDDGVHFVFAQPSPDRPSDRRDEAALWRWLTPAEDGRITVTLRPAGGEPLTPGPELTRFVGARFVDVQRWRLAMRDCDAAPTPGPALYKTVRKGRVARFETMAASALANASCEADPASCPRKYRSRVLAIARRFREAPVDFVSSCGGSTPPASADSAREYKAWVLAALSPPVGTSEVAWWKTLETAGLVAAEWQVEARFKTLRKTGEDGLAAALVDAAGAAGITLSESIRYEAAQAYLRVGDHAKARARLEALAAGGRTVFATFAQRALEALGHQRPGAP